VGVQSSEGGNKNDGENCMSFIISTADLLLLLL
jgi:hypothetical protein